MNNDRTDTRSDPFLRLEGSPAARMLVRTAMPQDYPAIIDLLKELELDYPARDLTRFLAGEIDGQILAIAELKEYQDFFLLSCVGVKEDLQGSGVGRVFVNRVLQNAHKDVYLYTLVPGFFKKTGFVEAAILPAGLPPRLIYGCASCDPAFCRCLVRKSDAPKIPAV